MRVHLIETLFVMAGEGPGTKGSAMRASILALALLVGVAGCRAPQLAGIPLGHWSGAGRFVSIPAAESATQPQPDARSYETTLDIRPGTGLAAGRLRFEIVSQRGAIEGLDGDRTHLVFELEPGSILDDGHVRLFRIPRAGVSVDEDPPTLEEDPKSAICATAVEAGGETSLHVIYRSGEWRDVFLFRGNRVTKVGTLESLENENIRRSVCWVEELTRR